MRIRSALRGIGVVLLCVTLAGCAQAAFWPFTAGPDPAAVQEAFLQGEQAVLEQDYAAAAAAFEKLLDIDPGNVDAMLWLGRCRLLLSDSAAAAEVLKAASDKAPSRADILGYLAKALLGSGDLAAAEDAYQRLRAIDPNDASAYAGLEKVYIAMKDDEKLSALRGMPPDTPADGEESYDYQDVEDGWISVPVDNGDGEDGGGWATIPPEQLVTPAPAEATPEPGAESTLQPPAQPSPTPVPYDPNMPQLEDETGWDEYGG